jgi:hypothetical protein
MSTLSTQDLSEFISLVDDEYASNLNHPELVASYYPIQLGFTTRVDQNLSPFSDEYFMQQLALYEEISGRRLNQWDGELHPLEIADLIEAPNPLGIRNVSHVSEHVRALSSMLSLTGLGDCARILDMGAGHGVSSEVFAFCGCRVHAIDIDPTLAELSNRRSAIRTLGIQRSVLNFDNIESVENYAYAAAFFFQSLHHCLRPWQLIETLKSKISKGGVIGFTGEPIQSMFWKNWGLRLDPESLYVARKFGWFESGWSHQFIQSCFCKNGMRLAFLDGGHAGGEIGIASESEEALASVKRKASNLGFSEVDTSGLAAVSDSRYYTQIGVRCTLMGLASYTNAPAAKDGFLCFGPYIRLDTGRYRVRFLLERAWAASMSPSAPHIVLDVVGNQATTEYLKEDIRIKPGSSTHVVDRYFDLSHEVCDIEARVRVVGGGKWTCSFPMFSQADDLA